jgi:hypothetical protein
MCSSNLSICVVYLERTRALAHTQGRLGTVKISFRDGLSGLEGHLPNISDAKKGLKVPLYREVFFT